MKKRILPILLSALLLLCSCVAQPEEVSDTAVSQTESTDSGDADRLAELEETVSELRAELAEREKTIADLEERAGRLTDKRFELEDELEKEKNTVSELRAQIEELQGRLEQKPAERVKETIWTEYGTVYHVEGDNYTDKLYIRKTDGTTTDIYQDVYITYLRRSPDGKKLIWSDFAWEVNATVCIYDLASGKLTRRDMDDLGDNQTPSYMDWFDDRYFLFVVQFDHGTVALGGDVYVYDTQTDEYRLLITPDTDRLMITSFSRRWQSDTESAPWLFSAAYYDDGFAEHTELYYRLTREELYDLIENGKTVTFSAIAGF